MSTEPPNHPEKNALVPRPSTALASLPQGGSPAVTEIISRSLDHIQASSARILPERRAGEEQKFEIAPGVKIVMCWMPPGEFLMGSPEDEVGRNDDEVQHLVTLTQGFWLGKYQVTQDQWVAVMGNNPSRFLGSNLPVETVSWHDVSEPEGFLGKINRFAAAAGTYSLPTEAQWEYACRAGTMTALNSGKNLTIEEGVCPNLDEVAWYGQNSWGKTHPVGQKMANAWGLHDMHGNVWEWCEDWYEDYTDEPLVDPRGLYIEGSHNTGSLLLPGGESFTLPPFRVPTFLPQRGGDWGDTASNCRGASRDCAAPSYTGDNGVIGFRIARSSIPQ